MSITKRNPATGKAGAKVRDRQEITKYRATYIAGFLKHYRNLLETSGLQKEAKRKKEKGKRDATHCIFAQENTITNIQGKTQKKRRD